MRIGYARVSTPEQSCVLQCDALEQSGCTKVFQGVCPTFYTRSSSVICGPCSINLAMSRERYLTA